MPHHSPDFSKMARSTWSIPASVHARALALLLIVLPAVFLASTLAAQDGAMAPFSEEARVTAMDLLVSFAGKDGDDLPPYLVPDDFEVLYDGQRSPVVGVSAYGPAQNMPDGEPWTFVLFFDLSLSNPGEVAWAATELGTVAEKLTDLGDVEVVTADPVPRRILAPTRDTERLQDVLARLALFPAGGEHEILQLRDEFLQVIAAEEPEVSPAELAAFAVTEEARIVRRQQDGLLSWLLDRGPAGVRRALFWITGGFDVEPADFYRTRLDRIAGAAGELEAAMDGDEPTSLEEDVDRFARTLAGYGWIVVPFATPPDPGPPSGPRLGKWRLVKPKGEIDEPPIVGSPDASENQPRGVLNFLRFVFEEKRDDERAESYVELGESLRRDGELEDAENAYRLALYHYAENPGTAAEQAKVLMTLGEIYREQNRQREAVRVLERAKELGGDIAAVDVGPVAELLEPRTPGEMLAGVTTGAFVRREDTVRDVVEDLQHRVRLTFQVSGRADGRLHEIGVRCLRKKCRIEGPEWTRSGTPEEVAAMRIRRMWQAEELIEGALALDARLVPIAGGEANRYRLEATLTAPEGLGGGEGAGRTTVRMSLGTGDFEDVGAVRHETREVTRGEATWYLTSEIVLPPEHEEVAVLVEHLETGAWGARLVEPPKEPAPSDR